MYAIYSTSYSLLSANFKIVEIQDDITYYAYHLSFNKTLQKKHPTIVGNIIYNVCYILLLCFREQTVLKGTKALTKLSAIYLVTYFTLNQQFKSGKITYNICYLLHLIILCISEL